MYLKVYYNQNHQFTSENDVPDIQSHVQSSDAQVEFNENLGYVCVDMPSSKQNYQKMVQIAKQLKSAGYETEDI